jgi:signal transduction histidine kinase/CheY-like chemotaxis protein
MKTINITNRLTDFKNRYVNSHGEMVYFSWNVIQNDGKYYCSAENITEKIRIANNLYKSNQYLEEIEKISRIGYWEWCISNGELIWSSGLKDIYELYEPDYESYMNCNYPEDVPDIKKTIEKCLLDKKKYTIEHRVIRNNSKEVIWIKAVGKIIIKEENEYLIGIVQDITEEYNIKENYKLQGEKAIETSNIKSKFVASVSHELRTPLNGIIGMVSLLGMTPLTEKQGKYIKILDSSCGVLLSIINNILDFSKIESGKIVIDYNSFDVEKSVNDVVELFKPSAFSKNLELTLNINKDVDNIMSDEIKIKQIVTNLLSNSMKFTRKGGIDINVKLSNSNLNIRVCDTGMGISGQFLKKIAEPFTQENATSIHGGSGLGMSIIKSYLDILKGTIDIQSELGVGTKVSVNIPVHLSDYKKVIVVIEDNYANSFILKEMISEATDYLVEIYEDGQDYIDKMEKQQPLLIFMDLHMPRLDGISTTKYLREVGYNCPIVAVTANNVKSDKVRGYDAGMTDFIIKPVSMMQITECMTRYIKNTKSGPDLDLNRKL